MFRRLLVIFMIATLVACPFRCGGMFGDACASEAAGAERTSATCGCECCRNEAPPTNEEDEPTVPGPCDCADCICEGAVLSEKVGFVAEEAPSHPLDATLPLVTAFDASNVAARPVRPPDADPPSGRSIRVLHRSLRL